MKRWAGLVLAGLLAQAGCGPADPINELAAGEFGRVVRIIDGDAFVLDTGQTVRLVAIEAPAPAWRDREGEPFADEARRILEDMVLGREVQLHYAGLSRDRYDRALAHAVTADNRGPSFWINQELVRSGAARVRVYPDTARQAESLIAVEAEARQSGRGLWALDHYRIRRATEIGKRERGFVVIQGVLGEDRAIPVTAQRTSQGRPRPPPACIRAILASEVTLSVTESASELCALSVGERVEARGYLRDGRLEVTHRLNLTRLIDGSTFPAETAGARGASGAGLGAGNR